MTATIADLDRARDIALDLSGWGRRFTFYQPRNFAFWGYLVLVGTGIFISVSRITRAFNAYGQAIALAVTLFAMAATLALTALLLPSGAPPEMARRMAIGHGVGVVLFVACGLLFRHASAVRGQ